MPKLTHEIIEAAIGGFEAQKLRIDANIAELRALLSPVPASTGEAEPGKKKRKFSAAALQHIREAQQSRWAKAKGEPEPAANAAPKSKPKRKLSAAGRKAIVDALKKRWADKKSK
jgi:hypothetical protein